MSRIKSLLVMAIACLSIVTAAFGGSVSKTWTMSIGQKLTFYTMYNGRYVKPTLVSATSTPGAVFSYKMFSSLSNGNFGYVIAKKAGTGTLKVRYGSTYYYFNIKVTKPTVVAPSFTPLNSSWTRYKLYRSKTSGAKYYRLRWYRGSKSKYSTSKVKKVYSKATRTSWSTSPSWTFNNAKKGYYYYFWMDVKTAYGTIYYSKGTYRWVKR